MGQKTAAHQQSLKMPFCMQGINGLLQNTAPMSSKRWRKDA